MYVCFPLDHLSWSNVVTVGIGAAASSTLQLTVVDLDTHFAITGPSFNAHTRYVSWTCVHALSLHKGGAAMEKLFSGKPS